MVLITLSREMEVRRRKKEEQNAALESKIEAIRRKAREADEWKAKKQQLSEKALPFLLGLAVVAGGALAAMYFK